jgi:hypothetical protein
LEYLFKLATTEDYAGRRKVLTTDKQYDILFSHGPDLENVIERHGSLPEDPENLGMVRGPFEYFRIPGWLDLSKQEREAKDACAGTPFYDDSNKGPRAAWEWAYGYYWPGHLTDEYPNSNAQQWGYVSWDMLRLENSGILQQCCYSVSVDDELEKFLQPERRKALWQSQEERRRVSRTGQKGWWSFEESSKVECPLCPPPFPVKAYVALPQSPTTLEGWTEWVQERKL